VKKERGKERERVKERGVKIEKEGGGRGREREKRGRLDPTFDTGSVALELMDGNSSLHL